jgi:hypothetical protein
MAVPNGLKPPTFGLGNRFGPQLVNDLRPDVANVLHPFPSDKLYTWLAIRSANIVLWDPIRGLSLLKTLNAGETPGFLWLSEF